LRRALALLEKVLIDRKIWLPGERLGPLSLGFTNEVEFCLVAAFEVS
jgi:hypothetical protein